MALFRTVHIEIDGRRVPSLGSFNSVVRNIHYCWDWRATDQEKLRCYKVLRFIGGEQLEEYARSIGHK